MTLEIANAITRRNLLSSTAKGTLALGMVTSFGFGVQAKSAENELYWTKERTERYLCKQIHAAKSGELTQMMHSPYLDKAQKNLALKTAHCPKCQTRIHPAQVIDPYVVAA